MITFDAIEKLLDLYPGLEVSTSYGTPAIKVRGKLILRMHQEEDAFVVMLASVEEQQELIGIDPEVFFLTEHYKSCAAVLVRPTIEESGLRELIETAWRRLARKTDIAEYDREV